MSPIPPDTLERLLLHGCEEGREPESQQMRELMTRLAISRRTKADARLVAQLKKGEACSWQHIHAIVQQRLDTWWHEWREDEDDQQQHEGDDEESGEEQKEEDDDEDSRPLPGQSHDYTGPDFATFALSCPLPRSFTFFSLSLHQRVVLLRCLCDDHLAFAADFAATVRGVEARDARIPPLGSDSSGHRYFFFGFPDNRIYREDNIKPVKPRQLKADRLRREQAEASKASGRDSGEGEELDDGEEEEDEKEHNTNRKAAPGKRAKKDSADQRGRSSQAARSGEDMSAPSTPSSRGDDEEDDTAVARTRLASTSPRFQLLSSSPASLLALVSRMRKSAYSKDKTLSKQLQTIYDDLQQGKGRKDSDEQAEEASSSSSEQSTKRKRKDWGNGGEVAKRSMRLMLVMAEKEEEQRQQRLQAEQQRKRVEQRKDESIAELAELYLSRHDKANRKRR